VWIQKKLKEPSAGDLALGILSSIPGKGLLCATTVRAFIDDMSKVTGQSNNRLMGRAIAG
jgi:hypothetical protein